MAEFHKPVLSQFVVSLIAEKNYGILVDGTLGTGGHSEIILKNSKGSLVIGIDVDEEAVEIAKKRLGEWGDRFIAVAGSYAEIPRILEELSASRPEIGGRTDAILLDLGLSSIQLDDAQRGFSFRFSAVPDMRFSKSFSVKAVDILLSYPAGDLARVLERGGVSTPYRVANAIIRMREKPGEREKLCDTQQLGALIARLSRREAKRSGHPATRFFQALRIEVNRELENLEVFLQNPLKCLNRGGRIAVISYHSGEDRMAKRCFRALAKEDKGKIITKRPLCPDAEEISMNPRARSAKLRCFESL